MNGQLYIAPGDISQLAAHAIAYSASAGLESNGQLYPSFRANVPGFDAWYTELTREHAGKCKVGDTFWFPRSAEARPHGVAVVIATGGTRTEEDKAAIAVRAAVDESVKRLREELGRSDRLLIALPTFRLGGGGDRHYRLRSARAQVAAAIDAVGRHSGVDVAFVTYTPAVYHIFLEVRLQLLGAAVREPACDPALEEALLSGECVLFVGAGLSRGAGLPDWNGLISGLAEELDVPPHQRHDYLDLAQWYRERFGTEALCEVLRRTFSIPALEARPTLAHYLLMSLPVRKVLTTNYDNLLERSLTALKRYPVTIVRQEDVTRTGREDGVHVIKLHGDAADPREIVLCRDDYDEFFERRPAMALLLEGLLLDRTFFFVGYGLRDPNFRQVFSRITRMLREARRPAFATTFESGGESGAYVARQWRNKQLHLIGIVGTDPEEREAELLAFLDRLATRVALRRPRLFLAEDVTISPELQDLRDHLLRYVAPELERICMEGLDRLDPQRDLRHIADVLGFLTEQGWRPPRGSPWSLRRLWEHLATAATDPSERRRMLVAALGAAEHFGDAERISRRLAELDSVE